ncbi:MAG: four helix bundle protein [Chloroflexota bacterium]|nr:four helix bundle protein [Chloroflexota bacterium]
MGVQSYRDLEVWRQSMDLAETVWRLSARFPAQERYGMTSQLRRAASSVPANIAEGAQRNGTGEYLQFLGIASGSLAETETFLLLAERLNLLPPERSKAALEQADAVGRMLSGLKRSLQTRKRSGK